MSARPKVRGGVMSVSWFAYLLLFHQSPNLRDTIILFRFLSEYSSRVTLPLINLL